MLDVGPVNVRGAATGHRARVIWTDGTLYIVHSPKRIQKLSSEEPVLSGKVWRADTESGRVSFTRRGCSSCGYRLGRLSRKEITG